MTCVKIKTTLFFMLSISSAAYQSQAHESFFTSLDSFCAQTLHPEACFHSLSAQLDSKRNYDSQFIYNMSVRTSIDEVFRAFEDFSDHGVITPIIVHTKDKFLLSALESCRDFLSLALYNLNASLATDDSVTITKARAHFRTKLSAAGADLRTCLDDFEHAQDVIRKAVAENLEKPALLVSTSLEIISKIDDYYMSLPTNLLMKSSSSDASRSSGWWPDWETLRDVNQMKPDAVVAADGSGDYTTINKAIAAVPQRSSKRFVIYVKEGVYVENVVIDMNKWNILMYGDGMEKTVVSGNRSKAKGWSTTQSATFSVVGNGFMGRDIGFRNTAGPGSQAVALSSSSDRSVFYRCLIEGYQDTLLTHSNHQFYRECNISGSIDFIFGDAAVVIQNSNILVKKGNSGLAIITAQGKDLPQSITGISIQNCSILPAGNLDGVKTFLGRPWKNYSTTVIMESWIGSFVDPQGWLPWYARVPSVPDTLLYVEYNNSGGGADTTKRVKWKGLRVGDTQDYARKFTVTTFLDGVKWLPLTGVPFRADL